MKWKGDVGIVFANGYLVLRRLVARLAIQIVGEVVLGFHRAFVSCALDRAVVVSLVKILFLTVLKLVVKSGIESREGKQGICLQPK
jgi:hypothetical protein